MIYGPQPLTEDDMKRWEAIQRAALELSESAEGQRSGVRKKAETASEGAGLGGRMPPPRGKAKDYWWNN